jgi:hypothetical protein
MKGIISGNVIILMQSKSFCHHSGDVIILAQSKSFSTIVASIAIATTV